MMNSTEIRMYEKTLLEELVMAILEKDIISLGKFIKDICCSPYFIKEQIFWQNFIEFLDNTFSDNDELRRFSVKLEEDGDSYENAKRIIKIIDDAGTKKKAIYISNLTRAYCLGNIDLYKYFKLTQCIIRLTDEDLIFLCDNISSKHIDTDEDYIDDFRNCGLLKEVTGGFVYTKRAYELKKYSLWYGHNVEIPQIPDRQMHSGLSFIEDDGGEEFSKIRKNIKIPD